MKNGGNMNSLSRSIVGVLHVVGTFVCD